MYNNQVIGNNTPNFADPGGGAAWQVPAGSGIILLASNYVEVFGNTVSNNGTLGIANASYLVLDSSFDPTSATDNPTGLNPFSTYVYAHDNTFSNNGGSPQPTNVYAADGGDNTNQLGQLFAALLDIYDAWAPASSAPNIVWTASHRLPTRRPSPTATRVYLPTR